MRTLLCFCLFLMAGLPLSAQTPPSYWTPVSEGQLRQDIFRKQYKPSSYKMYKLEYGAFRQALTGATARKGATPAVFTFPNAEGQPERFAVTEASVMEPALAARYPGLRSYSGKGIDDPTSTIRFDVSPAGFNAIILSGGQQTLYINEVDATNQYYIIFSRQDARPVDAFRCLTKDSSVAVPIGDNRRGALPNSNDGQLRTFRLALAATGEYGLFFLDGTETTDQERKLKVMTALHTMVTRMNGIYERDFGVRMLMVANSDKIAFFDPAKDPWTGDLYYRTQYVCDSLIGNDNYDVGHVVSQGGSGGVAGGIGAVCLRGVKGTGYTSTAAPVGDPFTIDYVAHELGHMFGANHTFSMRTEGTGANMEPGSGSTIMGYAGITGLTDVQPNSDDYFHTYSIRQVTDYINFGAAGANCAVVVPTGNNVPIVNAGRDYVIPRSTPFMLTGLAQDLDAGDVLTYCWEQVDDRGASGSGFSSIPDANSNRGPLFRSFKPVLNPSRMFPRLPDILSGLNGSKWEVLPAVARTLTFRLTVKDNRTGGGANASADARVTIADGAGPFKVTYPDTSLVWGAGTKKTVTWNVARSNLAPVNCRNVRILLSTDGGYSFRDTLSVITPNDGSEVITVPNITTTRARIKVEAIGNIFFDISNRNIKISPLPSGLNTINITASSATLLWHTLAGAYSYEAQYRLLRDTLWTIAADGTWDTTAQLSNLRSDTTYEWRVRSWLPWDSSDYAYTTFRTEKVKVCKSIYDTDQNDSWRRAVDIPLNTLIRGAIDPADDVDYYRFQLQAGEVVVVKLDNLPADYNLSLRDKDGKLIKQSYRSGLVAEEISYTVPTTGLYHVAIAPADRVNGAGPGVCYHLTVTTATTLRNGAVTVATPNIGNATAAASRYTVYPNPARHEIRLQGVAGKTALVGIQVFNVQGKLVKQSSAVSPQQPIDISALPSGTYILQVQERGQVSQSIKFIKE
ncbi:reprolysin-like metallopeptidase [Chitinophaga sp. MD30]|uniref:reprolysin-like metallopeptidase n=1 Tax=Chitinophaga sp. MD30 TaxID=2033437 RepID=UPI000BB0A0B0|nr:zinc-dependent metalloprotease family protein [Chitinophaga sp. MD30]ASZ12304.1 hypothetical protein CK934_15715 [Chitinophaga sp. MD30]